MDAFTLWFIASVLAGALILASGIYFERYADKVASTHHHRKHAPKCFWCRWVQDGPLVGWFAFLAGVTLPTIVYQLG